MPLSFDENSKISNSSLEKTNHTLSPTSSHTKRILVTGGNGFIGSHLCRRLKELGHSVTVLDIKPSNPYLPPNEICDRLICKDARDPSVCKEALQGIDWVFHLAANIHDPKLNQLLKHFASNPQVRIRVNTVNIGAPASRNRGIQESSAPWILFLDDDIHPKPDLLIEYAKAIKHQWDTDVVGFVGDTQFPPASNPFTRSVKTSDVTYFYSVCKDFESPPWGVTANILVQRSSVRFRSEYPRTGGGEDIHFCVELSGYDDPLEKKKRFVAVPSAIVTHPYWHNGARSYSHFYNWGKGDGLLNRFFPHLTYRSFPTAPEYSLIFLLLGFMSLLISFSAPYTSLNPFLSGLVDHRVSLSLFLFSLISWLIPCIDQVFRFFVLEDRHYTDQSFSTRLSAYFQSGIVINAIELGHLVGHLQRFDFGRILTRFDWFVTRFPESPTFEKRRHFRHFIILCVLFFLFFSLCC